MGNPECPMFQVTHEELAKAKQELKAEIQNSGQEILAATKFSYAEIDRRLTRL